MHVVTIGDFILARVDEDEFLASHMLARRAPAHPSAAPAVDVAFLSPWDPERVVMTCAARRRVVLAHRSGLTGSAELCDCGRPESVGPPCYTVRALALEWAAHPDYRVEWRAHPVPRQARSA